MVRCKPNPGVCKGHAGYMHEGGLPAARKTRVAAGKETAAMGLIVAQAGIRAQAGNLSMFCCLKDVALIVAEKELVLCLYFFNCLKEGVNLIFR